MIEVYIGLGSNLDGPIEQVSTAMDELARLHQSKLVKSSSLYRSSPLGPQQQPDFINAVVKMETGQAPSALLDELQRIEQRHGRTRTFHWGPRTLDLDILIYGNLTMDTGSLTIPHPQLAHRSFVLEPLMEIAPYGEVPGLGQIAELYRRLQAMPLQKVGRDEQGQP